MTSTPSAVLGIAVTLALGSSACKDLDPPPPPPFRVAVVVESDPGAPVAGAIVTRGAKVEGTTGADGRAELELRGADGEVLTAEVRCPDGYKPPARPISLRLSRIEGGGRVPEYQVACPPLRRRVVIAVRADNGPNLPIRYLDQVVARTDASGAAHFALEAPSGAQLQVTLDTSEKGNERLKPQSPTRPFTVGQSDELLVFEQRFTLEKKKVVYKKKQGIVCLTCGG